MIYDCDGFQWSANPSPGGGFTIVNEQNQLVQRKHIRKSGWTNNDAELWAIAAAVHLAKAHDTIRSDSEVCVKWWVPRGVCKSRPDLNPLCKLAHDGIRDKRLTLIWTPRDTNRAGIYNDAHHPIDGKIPYVGRYDTNIPTSRFSYKDRW